MRKYVIDELNLKEFNKIKSYFDQNFIKSVLDEIYWIKITSDILTKTQKEHKECSPFCFAVNVSKHKVVCELLVRSMNKINCKCMSFANNNQLNWIVKIINDILKN